MILFLLLNLIANAETMWVDQNGVALYKSLAHCEKYSKGVSCYKTDEGFDKEYYELVGDEFVKNPQLEQNKLAERQAKQAASDAKKAEFESLKAKVKSKSIKLDELARLVELLLEK